MENWEDYDWYCDGCDSYLNDQEDFDGSDGTWVCEYCGFENNISEDNIVDEDDPHIDHVECPECGGHMRMATEYSQQNVWVCEECGLEGTYEDGNIWS